MAFCLLSKWFPFFLMHSRAVVSIQGPFVPQGIFTNV